VTKEKIVAEFANFSKEDQKGQKSEELAENAFKATWKIAREDIKQLLAAQDAGDKVVVEDNKLEKILGTQPAFAYDQ